MNNNNLTVLGKTFEQWIEQEIAPRTLRMWGDEYPDFKPAICEEIIGDGLQLVYLMTISQRPYYWLIRIDSKTDINADEFDFEDILQPIEECFGRADEWLHEDEFNKLKSEDDEDVEDYKDYEDWKQNWCKYPEIYWDGGSWGLIVNMVTGETEI